MIFDPPAAIKSLKTSCYGQWKGLKALEYSHLRAFGYSKKSRDSIFGKPGIGILKKSWDIVGSRRGLVVGSPRAPSVLLETKYDVVKINSNKVPSAHIFCYWKVSNITHRSIFNTDTNPTTVTFRLIFDLFELTHNFARTGHRWRALSTAFWSASPPLTLSLSSPPSSCSVCQGDGQYSFSKNWCHWHIFFSASTLTPWSLGENLT